MTDFIEAMQVRVAAQGRWPDATADQRRRGRDAERWLAGVDVRNAHHRGEHVEQHPTCEYCQGAM